MAPTGLKRKATFFSWAFVHRSPCSDSHLNLFFLSQADPYLQASAPDAIQPSVFQHTLYPCWTFLDTNLSSLNHISCSDPGFSKQHASVSHLGQCFFKSEHRKPFFVCGLHGCQGPRNQQLHQLPYEATLMYRPPVLTWATLSTVSAAPCPSRSRTTYLSISLYHQVQLFAQRTAKIYRLDRRKGTLSREALQKVAPKWFNCQINNTKNKIKNWFWKSNPGDYSKNMTNYFIWYKGLFTNLGLMTNSSREFQNKIPCSCPWSL